MAKPLINISRQQAILFAFFLVLYEFLTYIANDMIMPGMIHVVSSFHASENLIATSLTLYILGGASLQLILGPISDAYGRRPMMLLGAFLFFLFTLLIIFANSMHYFLIARFFQGTGLCFIFVIGYATIQEIFDEMDAIRFIAIMANAAILAPLLGPVLGALIIYYTSWRAVFIIIAFPALLALWGLWKYMPEPIGQVKKDGSLIPKNVFSLRLCLKNYGALLKNPVFCCTTLASGIIGIPCIAWIALAPVILVIEGKLTVIQYGLWQIPIFGATILGNWFLHRLTNKYSLKTIITIGCFLTLGGTLLMVALPYFFGSSYLYIVPGIVLYFFAASVVNAPLNRYCLYSTAVSKGTASALLSLITMLTAAAGIELSAQSYQSHSNLAFACYCAVCSILFLIFIILGFKTESLLIKKIPH